MTISELNIEDLNNGDLTLDALTADWNLYQLKKGHRFSADDLFTAFVAWQTVPTAKSFVDLGSGVGSVGLLTLSKLSSDSRLLMVEAQHISFQLAQKTIAHNHLEKRVEIRHGDIRNNTIIPEVKEFKLVTGSPPYIPLGKGIASPHPQRAACRMELRGNIFDYAARAKSLLQIDGFFIVCFAFGDTRAREAFKQNSLHIRRIQNIIFRADLPPTIAIYAVSPTPGKCELSPPIAIRDKHGKWTTQYMQIRHQMGFPKREKPV